MPAALLLLLAIASADAGAPDPNSCANDADCVVTTFSSCCGACPADPHPSSKAALQSAQRMCEVVDCSGPRSPCPRAHETASYQAVCTAGRCAMKRTSPPACQTDADCTLSEQASCCDACPASPPLALDRTQVKLLSNRCAKMGKCAPSREPCPKVPPLASFRAACDAGSCVTERRAR